MSIAEREIEIFRGLSDELIERLKPYAAQLEFKGGSVVIWQGDPADCIYCVLVGEVEIYRLSPGGREQILNRMGSGACFNLAPALLENGINQANVRALTDCRLLTLSAPDFKRMIVEIPRFGLAVSQTFAKRLAHMTNLVETLGLYSVRQRLASFLIDQADAGEGRAAVRWTQTDMANRLGTVRDVLGRTLRKMADEGMLRIERENILLLDREKLDRAARGE